MDKVIHDLLNRNTPSHCRESIISCFGTTAGKGKSLISGATAGA